MFLYGRAERLAALYGFRPGQHHPKSWVGSPDLRNGASRWPARPWMPPTMRPKLYTNLRMLMEICRRTRGSTPTVPICA